MEERSDVNQVIEFILNEKSKPAEDEQRAAKRHVIMLPVTAYVMEKRSKLPTPVDAIVRDISSSGVAVLFREPIQGEAILIDFGETYDNAAFAFEPIRTTTTGGFFQLAGPFIETGLER